MSGKQSEENRASNFKRGRKNRGRFENTGTNTPSIGWHKDSLLINRIYNTFRNWKYLLRATFERKRL